VMVSCPPRVLPFGAASNTSCRIGR
jgi:hypothetical protein